MRYWAMNKFSKEKVMLLQKLIVESSGGTYGVRDFALLESALESAFQTFDGVELYPTKEEKAARLGIGLIANHAFLDGNKRTGLLVMDSFLAINGMPLEYTDDEFIQIGFALAKNQMTYQELLEWIKTHKKVF